MSVINKEEAAVALLALNERWYRAKMGTLFPGIIPKFMPKIHSIFSNVDAKIVYFILKHLDGVQHKRQTLLIAACGKAHTVLGDDFQKYWAKTKTIDLTNFSTCEQASLHCLRPKKDDGTPKPSTIEIIEGFFQNCFLVSDNYI